MSARLHLEKLLHKPEGLTRLPEIGSSLRRNLAAIGCNHKKLCFTLWICTFLCHFKGSLLEGTKVEFWHGNYPVADKVTYQTAEPDIFVGGDVYTGPKFAIDAIAAGKQGAISIHRYVQPHSSLTIGRDPNYYVELDKDDYSVEKYDNTGRQRPAKKSGVDKLSFRSDAGVFTEEQVKKETARCLGCGATIVDENQCVGCGICTTKCEFDAIHLQRDLPECSTMRRSEDKLKYILPYGAKQAIKIKFKKKKD